MKKIFAILPIAFLFLNCDGKYTNSVKVDIKETGKTSVTYFYDPEEQFKSQYFMKYDEGEIILSVDDPDDQSNPSLLFISKK